MNDLNMSTYQKDIELSAVDSEEKPTYGNFLGKLGTGFWAFNVLQISSDVNVGCL